MLTYRKQDHANPADNCWKISMETISTDENTTKAPKPQHRYQFEKMQAITCVGV